MVASPRGRGVSPAGQPAVLLVLFLALSLGGCELVEGIFQVGLWAGVIIVLLVVVLIWLVSRLFR